MAFTEILYANPPLSFNIRAVQAGDAAEMVTRVQNEFAASIAAGEIPEIGEFKLAGCGSGPQWEAWFVVAEAEFPAPLAGLRVVAAVAGNPTEAVFYAKQRLAAAVGSTPTTIYKVEVAGAGDGPTYMAVIVFGPTPPR